MVNCLRGGGVATGWDVCLKPSGHMISQYVDGDDRANSHLHPEAVTTHWNPPYHSLQQPEPIDLLDVTPVTPCMPGSPHLPLPQPSPYLTPQTCTSQTGCLCTLMCQPFTTTSRECSHFDTIESELKKTQVQYQAWHWKEIKILPHIKS